MYEQVFSADSVFTLRSFYLVLGHNNDVECYTNDPRTATFSIGGEQEIRCNWLMTQKAHQQPITCLECEGDRILTGSQDHTLKV